MAVHYIEKDSLYVCDECNAAGQIRMKTCTDPDGCFAVRLSLHEFKDLTPPCSHVKEAFRLACSMAAKGEVEG